MVRMSVAAKRRPRQSRHLLQEEGPLPGPESTDVVSLSQTSIDFGKDSVLVTLEVNDVKDTLDVTSGLLRFNCADLLGIDGHRDFVVLAGTLSFSYYDSKAQDSTNIATKKDFYNKKSMGGNFDVRIGRSNFDKK